MAAAAAAPLQTDAVVIGAGPVGLFQVFQLGLLGMRCHLIDALPHAGGQCAELYPDKPIYDIPAIPVCTGLELVERLLRQIEVFSPGQHWGQQVAVLQPQADGRFLVATDQGTQLLARCVCIAGGTGAFVPRRLKLPALDRFAGTQVLYSAEPARQLAGRHIVIAGDGDLALDAAVRLASCGAPGEAGQVGKVDNGRPASVTLLHRREAFRAAPATVAAMQALRAAGQMRFVAGQPTATVEADGRLTALKIDTADGGTQTLPLDTLLVLQGLSPQLGPVAAWGLALERRQLVVGTETFETNVPGIFAVGDINTYPGKRKLILCGFHEATLAAYAAAARVFPGQPVQLQYTTTSPTLQQRLGVAAAPAS